MEDRLWEESRDSQHCLVVADHGLLARSIPVGGVNKGLNGLAVPGGLGGGVASGEASGGVPPGGAVRGVASRLAGLQLPQGNFISPVKYPGKMGGAVTPTKYTV